MHLHSIGLAHNDINPANVLVSKEGMPVLADFGSCRGIGEGLGGSRGTMEWVDEEEGDAYGTSVSLDLFGIGRVGDWLDGEGETRV